MGSLFDAGMAVATEGHPGLDCASKVPSYRPPMMSSTSWPAAIARPAVRKPPAQIAVAHASHSTKSVPATLTCVKWRAGSPVTGSQM